MASLDAFCMHKSNVVFSLVAYNDRFLKQEEIKKSSYEKKRKLGQAFDVIKIDRDGKDMVTYRIWKRLMQLANSEMSKNQIDLLMLILDMNRSGHIGRREFMNVADLMNVPVTEVTDRMTWFEKCFPNIYLSTPSECLKVLVDSIFCKLFFDAIIIVNVFLIAFCIDMDTPFLVLFAVEIALKLYTYGPVWYFCHLLNWFDVIITLTSLLLVILENVLTDEAVVSTLRMIVVLRIFRILRFLEHIERFKIITDTIVNISQSIFIYAGIVFIMFYVFAIIGMELFHGLIEYHGYDNVTDPKQMYCGTEKLRNSSFFESHYCNINFNDFFSAIMTLSTLLVQNNWHILAEGYVLVTNKAARLYFAVFHLIICIVVMNIVTAFIVDMFMYEYTIQKNKKLDWAVEAKIKELGLGIDADTGMEISSPLSDDDFKDLMSPDSNQEVTNDKNETQRQRPRPWLELEMGAKMVDKRFSRIGTFFHNRKSAVAPTLNRFDGIRFHLKKRGWTKLEVLLQQLFETEVDVDVTVNLSS